MVFSYISIMGYIKIRTAAAVSLLHAVSVGIAATYSSTATESMKSDVLKPTDIEISWIGSTLALGALLGSVFAGYLSEKIGRKGVMIYLSVLSSGGWLLIAYAPSLNYIYAGRFITGFCCGLICVVTPMYIVEISPPEIRGRLGAGFQLYICFGIVLVSTLGKFLMWDWLAVCGAVSVVVATAAMVFVPESPAWLIMQGKHAEASHALCFLYGDSVDATEPIAVNLNLQSQRQFSLHDLLKRTIYKPALFSICLMLFQQFSGSNAVLFYTVSIFKQAQSYFDPTLGNIFVSCMMLFFTSINSMFIDSVGRKKFLFASSFMTSISMATMGIYVYVDKNVFVLGTKYGWIPLVCLLVYISAFSIGLGPIPWLMMSEMAPTRARGFICCVGTAFSWIFAFIVTKTFVNLEHAIHEFGAYWFYSCICLLSCVFTIFLPETKGQTLEQIENYFTGEQQFETLNEESNET